MNIPYPFLSILSLLIITINSYSQNNNSQTTAAEPKVITFDPDTSSYQEIFNGDKDSVVFYSGVVTLEPYKSGHIHSTEVYEEMIVVFNGQGQVKITNGKTLDLEFGNIAFIPPKTEHQVLNTGNTNLKYIYIATKSKLHKSD
jgi:mannose-6-phosphate isomerase-like protein (cupin superfamily)